MESYYGSYSAYSDTPYWQADTLMTGGGLSDNSLYLLYVVLFIVVIFVIYRMNDRYDDLVQKLNKQQTLQQQKFLYNKMQEIKEQQNQNQDKNQSKKISVNVNSQHEQINSPLRNPLEIMREYDYRTLNDPLVAPRRRDDYNIPILPYPTRGLPAPYKKVGILIDKSSNNNDRYKILLLMGRNKYSSSNVFDYYALENDKSSSLKFNIDKTRELQTDDKVAINELGKVYTVVTDKMLEYDYDPYIGY
jgi:hypothetical protein